MYDSQAVEEVPSMPRGVMWGCQGRMKTEQERDRQDLGHTPLVHSPGGVVQDSQAKAGPGNSKSGVLVNLVEVLPQRHVRERHWEAGELADYRAVG